MNHCFKIRQDFHVLSVFTHRRENKCIHFFIFSLVCFLFSGCAGNKASYDSQHKFSKAELQEDANVLWETFQKCHPSLYWYTAKDTVDAAFNSLPAAIADSMTEAEFRKLLAERVAVIRCGHTSVRGSKTSGKKFDFRNEQFFPLQVKTWAADSMVVLANAIRNDSVITRGTSIQSINGIPVKTITDSICKFISADGWHDNFRYQLISNNFPIWYKSIFGISETYSLNITTPAGTNKTAVVKNFKPGAKDSSNINKNISRPVVHGQNIKTNRLEENRKLSIDTAKSTAIMELNTFSEGHLRSFFKKSFKSLEEQQTRNLVIELRENGGGNIINSTKLTRYLTDHKFKVADTVAAIGFKYPYPGTVKHGVIFKIQSWFVTSRKDDGRLHYRMYEKKYFSPYTKHHFNGNVYIITGGFTFSASTLFLSPLVGQQNVKIVGEETGGDAYGNTAVNVPDIVLPNTGIRVRLPLYRIVVNKNLPHNGHGIIPDVIVPPNSYNLSKRIDPKMTKVYELIEAKTSN